MKLPLLALKEYYWENWSKIKDESLNKKPLDILSLLTKLVDEVIIELTKSAKDYLDKIAIISLGGYARNQFFPYSDVDILILYRDELSEEEKNFIKQLTTALWDLNITLGFQLKNINEIVNLSQEDKIFKTALLDNRFIIGSEELFKEFTFVLNKNIFGRNKLDYLMFKINNVRERAKKISNSIYILEPNLKETPGGLRDINTIYWICTLLFNSNNLNMFIFKNILKEKDLLVLLECIEFIFKIRINLHYYHKRKYDILNMESQKYLAQIFGYLDTSVSLGVEIFMKDYYKSANVIQENVNKIINLALKKLFLTNNIKPPNNGYLGFGFYKYNYYITFEENNFFVKYPKNLILIFYLAAQRNLKISDIAKDVIRENLYLINEDYIKKNADIFLKSISNFPYSSETVKNMIETKVLFQFIPEFEEIYCRPQFDYYHHYTVDEHTVLALKNIDNLISLSDKRKLPFIRAFKELQRKDLLALSILLHDIGKGHGKNHSIIGSKIAEKICYRFGIDSQSSKIVCNMVKHHLLMNHIAQRRNIKDFDVLKYFIQFINNIEELNILFLLTYADINALGGFNYSNWVNSLIIDLYENTKTAINNKDIVLNKEYVAKKKKIDVLIYFNNELTIKKLLDLLDEDYIYANSIETMISHLKLLIDITLDNSVNILINVKKDINCLDVTICTYDYLGLLRNITAGFLSFNLNILNAEVNTLNNGLTIDNFQVIKNDASIEEVISYLKEIKNVLRDLVLGNIDPYNILNEKLTERFEKRKITDIKHNIEIDNSLSKNYTIIDIYTSDTVGLLFKLLDKFCKLNINVQKAKISTDVDRVVDSFYVIDKNGNKITKNEDIENIKKILEECLNEKDL
jgi:[protein-PII] uridylyltransferase